MKEFRPVSSTLAVCLALFAQVSAVAAGDDAFEITDYAVVESPRQPQHCPLRGWVQCVGIWWRTPYIGRFLVEPESNDLIKDKISNAEVWEPHVVANIERYVVPGSLALDIGAYIGTHAMLMGRLVGPAGRVYAFEPQRKIFLELRHNVRLNGLDGVVKPLRFALGAKAGVVEMSLPLQYRGLDNVGGVGVAQAATEWRCARSTASASTMCRWSRSIVEGFEDAVLAGGVETVRASKPVILIEIMAAPASPRQRRPSADALKRLWRPLRGWGIAFSKTATPTMWRCRSRPKSQTDTPRVCDKS